MNLLLLLLASTSMESTKQFKCEQLPTTVIVLNINYCCAVDPTTFYCHYKTFYAKCVLNKKSSFRYGTKCDDYVNNQSI